MPDQDNAPLPSDVDPLLWFENSRCGRHYLVAGNPHTFPGRMYAYCVHEGIYTRVSLREMESCSEQTRYFVRGYLSGSEPPPPHEDDGSPVADDDPQWRTWRAATERFRETGEWTDPAADAEPASDDDDENDDDPSGQPGLTPEERQEFRRDLAELARIMNAVHVTVVIDMPHTDTVTAANVARRVAGVVAMPVGEVESEVSVGDPVHITRVDVQVGRTSLQPRAAVEAVRKALGPDGWTPVVAIGGEASVMANWRAGEGPSGDLDQLGVLALVVHVADGLH
jgi:hypothetical protein